MPAGPYITKPSLAASRSRSASPNRSTWLAEPPPFGVATERFADPNEHDVPSYHVAYRDVLQPPRWNAKGWVGIDDSVKGRRGTAPSLYGTSSLIPPSDPPRHHATMQPLTAVHPNETRLQELLSLQRRKVHTGPGPGQYDAALPSGRRRFRRQHDPGMDGPFFNDAPGDSTRVKEIAALIRTAGDSGLGPGEYDGLMSKDIVMRHTPAARVGTADRSGRTQHSKSLSISRSIQHGINWQVPVIVAQPAPAAPQLQQQQQPQSNSPREQPAARSGGAGGASPHDTWGSMPGGEVHVSDPDGRDSRDASPIGRAAEVVAGQLLGAPPAPPSQVARARRHDESRKPGHWDWNRLGHNYRTSWTAQHGGAYSHGEHPPPRDAGCGSGPSLPPAPGHMDEGIYPIPEESSGALSSGWPQQQPPQQHHYRTNQHAATAEAAGAAHQHHSQAYGAVPLGCGAPPGAATAAGAAQQAAGAPLERLSSHLREQDLQRRRAAAQAASMAREVSTRLAEWNAKYSG